MNPNILQSLVGSLSYGLHATEAVPALTAPAGSVAQPVISMIDGNGVEQIVFDGSAESLTACPQITHEYHVVYLLGGQVYFGRLRVAHDKRTINLEDAHYLVPSRSGKASLHLIRVGQELHAPAGELTVNMAYVISWQRLNVKSALMAAMCHGRSV